MLKAVILVGGDRKGKCEHNQQPCFKGKSLVIWHQQLQSTIKLQ